MASIALLKDEKLISFSPEGNESIERSDKSIHQNNIYPEDMSKKQLKNEEDHISARKSNNIVEISAIHDENTSYRDANSSVQRNNSQVNAHRTEGLNSNRDSGISGSSNESISQIPSPVEEEMEINGIDFMERLEKELTKEQVEKLAEDIKKTILK